MSRAAHQDRGPEADLVNAIEACRRRLVFVAFARHLPIALTAVTAVTALWVLQERPLAPVVAGCLFLIGCGGAGAVAVARRPSAARTAAAIDRRLGLPETVAAGLEHREARDPWGGLIVRDAAARTRTLPARRLFPLTLGPLQYACLATAVLGILAIAIGRPRPDRFPVPSAGQPSRGLPVASGTPTARSRPDAGTAPAVRPVASAAGPASPAAGRTASTDPHEGRPDAPESSRGLRERASRSGESPDASSSARSLASAGGDSGDPFRARAGTAARSGGAGRASATHGASGGAAAAAQAAGRAASLGGAGGAAGGGNLARRPPAAAAARVGTRGDSRPATAMATVEAAIARDDVPPEDRALVRRYFSTLGAMDRE